MSTTKTAVVVLGEAEAKLRELVGRAAAGGEYDLAVRMATVAKNVAALAHALDADGSQAGIASAVKVSDAPAMPVPGALPPTGLAEGASDTDIATPSPARDRHTEPATARRARKRGTKRAARAVRKRAPRKGLYPKFYRDEDYLVKVAWSKKERGEYQHKAPRRVAELLAAAIGKRSGNGRMFTSEDIFPLKDPQGGGDVPSYQAYAALAWFRQTGLVQPHGRRGYTVKKNGRLSELLTAGWQKLSESPK
jgi:hypothetical protein